MDTKLKLENALKDAMRANHAAQKRTLRLAIAAIRLAEVERGAALDEAEVLAILQREIKSRRETIQDAEKAHRPDLASEAEEEIAIIAAYLPVPLSPAELDALVEAAIGEAGASTPADMGKVMKVLMPRIAGRAPGDQVSQAVRRLLQKS